MFGWHTVTVMIQAADIGDAVNRVSAGENRGGLQYLLEARPIAAADIARLADTVVRLDKIRRPHAHDDGEEEVS